MYMHVYSNNELALTKVEPRREIAKTINDWIVALFVKIPEPLGAKLLQHTHTSSSTWSCPCYLLHTMVYLKASFRRYPVNRLHLHT